MRPSVTPSSVTDMLSVYTCCCLRLFVSLFSEQLEKTSTIAYYSMRNLDSARENSKCNYIFRQNPPGLLHGLPTTADAIFLVRSKNSTRFAPSNFSHFQHEKLSDYMYVRRRYGEPVCLVYATARVVTDPNSRRPLLSWSMKTELNSRLDV